MLYYALGGGAFGVHVISGTTQDPEAVNFFSRFLGDWLVKMVESSKNR